MSASTQRTALTLGLLVGIALLLVLVMERMTEPLVARSRAQTLERELAAVLPAPDPARTGDADRWVPDASPDEPDEPDAPRWIERRWLDGRLEAMALSVVAPDGYSGDIELLVGVRADGTLSGVRVLEHRETPGLGDDIERHRSDWITEFDGLSLHTVPARDWAVRRQGGRFDAFTGATITPQAVVGAVHRALRWVERHADALSRAPPP